MTVVDAIALVRRALGERRYSVRNEYHLQSQVAAVLGVAPCLAVEREVIASSGRFDLRVIIAGPAPVRLVLELKVRSSPAAVERQAQRYAMTDGVDGVIVATTSPVLAAKLADLEELGGKPFASIRLRGW